MAEPSLKVVPEAQPAAEAPAESKVPAKTLSRKRLRVILLVALPLVALAGGAFFYLSGGRYISTDNAYVSAQKVLITPDISGKVARVIVREGQRVKAGDELFDIDRQPFLMQVFRESGPALGGEPDPILLSGGEGDPTLLQVGPAHGALAGGEQGGVVEAIGDVAHAEQVGPRA